MSKWCRRIDSLAEICMPSCSTVVEMALPTMGMVYLNPMFQTESSTAPQAKRLRAPRPSLSPSPPPSPPPKPQPAPGRAELTVEISPAQRRNKCSAKSCGGIILFTSIPRTILITKKQQHRCYDFAWRVKSWDEEGCGRGQVSFDSTSSISRCKLH